MSGNNNPRGIFVIMITAMMTLTVLSMLPWGDWTNNNFKDFNLLADIIPQSDKTYITHEELDPELAALEQESHELAKQDTTVLPADTVPAVTVLAELPDDFVAPKQDDVVLIEDYSQDGSGLSAIKSGLSGDSYRIAVLGDSYIEGDIFTQDIRAGLQDHFGGTGVGYLSAYTAFPGFRQSVRQEGKGWKDHDIRKIKNDGNRILSGMYHTGTVGATIGYKGSSRPAHVDSWTKTTMLFIAPHSGTITVKGSDEYEEVFEIEASTEVQSIVIDRPLSSISIQSNIDGLISLGNWLETPAGVKLDCMSLRGNSGISHRNLNKDIIGQMRRYIDYDLIILEFGINALSSEQRSYTNYTRAMIEVVNEIKACYPDATILILGIGDRGQKQGTAVGSMSTAPAMVKAQREIARRTGSLFWDMREAMGGNGAVVDWHRRGLVNSDYIHLNHKGGKALAEIFVNSLLKSINGE
ncbi:MAG: hypothetical protein K2M00_07400 [Muribaculaceae bacterium]|nr:hypothetical protein [Muribaculaceae bacterium]